MPYEPAELDDRWIYQTTETYTQSSVSGTDEWTTALIGDLLDKQGLRYSGGTIVDATIIEAPTSTKNQDRQRDTEMHSTKKGNQWY